MIPFAPALVGLRCRGSFSSWAGIRTEGSVTLWVEDQICARAEGELQLTEYGISGIPVFQVSGAAIRASSEKKKTFLQADFFPEYSEQELTALLAKRQEDCPYKTSEQLFFGLLPGKLIRTLFKGVTSLEEAAHRAKSRRLEVLGASSLSQAQVCSGGVSAEEISPETMESRLVPGLYFAGEVVDVDAACGGFNLQWAWSSGAVAGINSAKERKI